MTNCSDNTYYIYYTDKALGAIAIPKSSLDQETLDITLLGKTRLEYGAVFNENLLHMLENYASNSENDFPQIGLTFANLLENPVVGQLWYNSSNKKMYVCTGANLEGEVTNTWRAINNAFSVAGNSGFVFDGETLPLPVAADGYEFTEAECVWHISPSYLNLDEIVTGINLSADSRLVVAEYTTASGTRKGLVNYVIIGVRNPLLSNVVNVPCATPAVTPTISVTPSITPSIGSSPTPTPSISPTRTVTPTPTLTRTPTRTPSVGASVTPTATPAPTPTPTPSTSPLVNPILLGEVTSEYEGIDDSVSIGMYLKFMNDGTWEAYSPTFGTTSGAWLASGLAEDYEIAAEYTAGFPEVIESGLGGGYRTFDIKNIPSGTLSKATFYELGTSRQVTADDDVFAPDATFNAVKITITIRKISNHAINSTLYLTCYLDGGCFALGTQLQTASGHYKKVENIAVGDSLRNFSEPTMLDENIAEWQTWSLATLDNVNIGSSVVTGVRKFTAAQAVQINGIISTCKHVYFVFDGTYKWKHADAITYTDKLVKSNKTLVDVTEIVNINEPTEFVAINVEDVDTLVVKSPQGYNIFTHNASA